MRVLTQQIVPLWLPVLIVVSCGSLPDAARGADEIGVKVPEGFSVQLFADDHLAHDISSLTIDAVGRVVVSGPGYVRILIDEDGDGQADRFQQFADGPATGAQGMYFHGPDLLCSGDAGLVRYRDQDADGRADGPPELFLKIKTGGEHNAHAIRKGPDGWWYLIAGNTADVTAGYATLPTSPVKHPEAGTLLRLKPDLSGGEIVAHGMRNAYDFDFNRLGDIFTFDSDDERDVSLPWYRPTRVFQLLPAAHLGWISKSWKRPDYFYDMPPVIASLGRASPTGVVCYRHRQFPESYRGALFVLDWTFGRVMALPMQRDGETWTTQPIEFMTARGQFGFAPTDAEVGPDGALYVSVGGRGTRGGVFRVTHNSALPGGRDNTIGRDNAGSAAATLDAKLASCLEAPQPLSSWSRAKWEPLAKELGAAVIAAAAVNEDLPVAERVRAIEILTDVFKGLSADLATQLAKSRAAEVRAVTAWSIDRAFPQNLPLAVLASLVDDSDPLVRRWALTAVAAHPQQVGGATNQFNFPKNLADSRRFVRDAAARALASLEAAAFNNLGEGARSSWRAALTYADAYRLRAHKDTPVLNAYAVEIGRRILEGEHPLELKLDAVRLLQLGLGDAGSAGKLPSAFDGYASPLDLTKFERDLDPLRIAVGRLYPTKHHLLDLELTRLMAMLTLYNPDVLDKVLECVTADSDPIDDIHHLLVATRMPVERSAAQQAAIAKGLVRLEPKLVAHKMTQDTNWADRITEMYEGLAQVDPRLSAVLIAEPGFGRPGHVNYLSRAPDELLPAAASAFAKTIAADPEYPWSNDVVFLFGAVDSPENRKLIREQYERFTVRSAVIVALARLPNEEDRSKYIEGLESSQLEVLTACVEALEKLPPPPQAQAVDEIIALVRTLRRIGTDSSEFPVRDQVVKLLERDSGKKFEYTFGSAGHRPQPAASNAWTNWACQTYVEQAAGLRGGSESDLESVKSLIAGVAWDLGDPARGKRLFTERACTQCHGGSRALGPDLAGVAGRFSREDLFIAIALPNRDVSPRYQTTLVETKQGKVYSGLIVYESVDGVLLRNSTNQTFRVEADQVLVKKKLSSSLMPAGLLRDLSSSDLADLYSYLQSLTPRTAESGRQPKPE